MPFEINGSGITAVGTDPGALVAFAGEGDAKMFRRRASACTPTARPSRSRRWSPS